MIRILSCLWPRARASSDCRTRSFRLRAILTFHSIDNSGSILSFSVRMFDALLAELTARAVPVCDLNTLLAENGKQGVAITFDDGMKSVLQAGLPVLQKYPAPAGKDAGGNAQAGKFSRQSTDSAGFSYDVTGMPGCDEPVAGSPGLIQNATFLMWLFVWPLAKLAALVPLTQGGIGVREAAQGALFLPFSVSMEKAVATGLIFQTIVIGGNLVAGLLAALLGSLSRSARGEDRGRFRMPGSLHPAGRLGAFVFGAGLFFTANVLAIAYGSGSGSSQPYAHSRAPAKARKGADQQRRQE